MFEIDMSSFCYGNVVFTAVKFALAILFSDKD